MLEPCMWWLTTCATSMRRRLLVLHNFGGNRLAPTQEQR